MGQQLRDPARAELLPPAVRPARQPDPDLHRTRLPEAVTEHPGGTAPGPPTEDGELPARLTESS